MMIETDERRKSPIRRDFNDMVRSPDGRISESKIMSTIFKVLMCYVFVVHADAILKDWMILTVFVFGMIAPDLLKKLMAIKLGVPPKEK